MYNLNCNFDCNGVKLLEIFAFLYFIPLLDDVLKTYQNFRIELKNYIAIFFRKMYY